jgi:glutaredoxin
MPDVTVTIYKHKDTPCVQCDATIKKLDRLGIDHTLVAYVRGDENHAYVTQQLGLSAAPGVVVKVDGTLHDSWGGNRPDRISSIRTLLEVSKRKDEAA